MVRRLVPFAVLLVVILGLPAAAHAGDEEVGSRPAPAQVARWMLGDDEADLARAAQALAAAPPSYLTEVIRQVRVHRKRSAASGNATTDAGIDRASVLLEARVYNGRRGLAKRLLGEGRMRGCHLLEAAETEALRAALRSRERAKVLNAPSLVIADGEWGTVKVTTPISFVKSVRVDGQGHDTVRSPVIGIVEEGLVLEVRPLVSDDGRSITLAGALAQTAVERPIPTRTVQVEGGEAEIQAPTVRESRLDLHFTAPDGATIAGVGLAHPRDADRELLVLITVRRVGGDTAPAPPPEGTRVVTMEVRLLRATPAALERVLQDRLPHPESPLRGLGAEAVVRLLGPGRRGSRGIEVLSAPRLTTFDGQRANVSVLNQTSYVKDFEVERSDGAVVLDPVIDTIQDGLVFEATPTITADRKRIGFDTLTTWAVLTRPIADFTTTIEGQEITVQIPELRVSRVREEFELQAGGYVLIGGFDEDSSGNLTCVLLHASVTDLDEEEKRLFDK